MDLVAVRGIEHFSDAAKRKLVQVAAALGMHPDWLASIISFETAGTFDPAKPNAAGSGAVGLIQFTPSTARGMHTTTAALAAMSAEEQLDWVYKYLQPFAGRLTSLASSYLAVFLPRGMGKSADTVLIRREDGEYPKNAPLDRGNKGYITVGDVVAAVTGVYQAGLARGRIPVLEQPPLAEAPPPAWLSGQSLEPSDSSSSGSIHGENDHDQVFRSRHCSQLASANRRSDRTTGRNRGPRLGGRDHRPVRRSAS